MSELLGVKFLPQRESRFERGFTYYFQSFIRRLVERIILILRMMHPFFYVGSMRKRSEYVFEGFYGLEGFDRSNHFFHQRFFKSLYVSNWGYLGVFDSFEFRKHVAQPDEDFFVIGHGLLGEGTDDCFEVGAGLRLHYDLHPIAVILASIAQVEYSIRKITYVRVSSSTRVSQIYLEPHFLQFVLGGTVGVIVHRTSRG